MEQTGKINCEVSVSLDIEDFAYQLTHEDAEELMKTVDRVICDLDFTQKMAKFFIEAVKAEGVDDYTNELAEMLCSEKKKVTP